MSSETAGPGAQPVSSKGARSLFAIVVSTPSTHTLRVERLDASTALLVSSGRTITPLVGWHEAFNIAVVPASAASEAEVVLAELDPALADELAPRSTFGTPPSRRRKDG